MSLAPSPPLLRVWRVLRLILHLAQGVVITTFKLPSTTPIQRDQCIRKWAKQLLAILNIQIQLRGHAPTQDMHGQIYIANHVSWLDIWLLMSVQPVRFISKADVRNWPVIGWLAAQTGTLFIERERRHHTAAIVEEADAALGKNDNVAFFPEGTTSNGLMLRRFHPSLFQIAINRGMPITPITIRYVLENGHTDTAPAYCDEMSLLVSFRAILARQQITAELSYLSPLEPAALSRRALAREAERVMADALSLPAPHSSPETPSDPPA